MGNNLHWYSDVVYVYIHDEFVLLGVEFQSVHDHKRSVSSYEFHEGVNANAAAKFMQIYRDDIVN